jgi:C4-dicarboxylate transporter/malic acid transport protein
VLRRRSGDPHDMSTLELHSRRDRLEERPSGVRTLTPEETKTPTQLFANLGPNWFASVMGTGIVAIAAVLLPVKIAGLRTGALVVWVLAAAMLAVLVLATALQWARDTDKARSHARNPAMAPFYGAPAMALLTVGAGALLVGRDLIGSHTAVVLDSVLWGIGTAAGLASSVAIPYLMFTHHRLQQKDALGSWLMPIVPPMVSAATGAALVEHLPAGQARLTLLLGCYAMFGLSLIASMVIISIVWARLLYHGPGATRTVPTVWIVLGPVGQSITAVNLLAAAAPQAIGQPYSLAMQAIGVLYGIPAWGFAMLWLSIAAAVTVSAARDGLTFTPAWWSFVFPIGTVVTGTSELAARTHLVALTVLSVALYVFLVAVWLTVVSRTVGGVRLRPSAHPRARGAMVLSSQRQNARAGS